MEKYIKWTFQDDMRLRVVYPDHSNRDIASLMGRTKSAVVQRALRLGLRKSAQYLLSHQPGQFRKGQASHNKGIAMSKYLSPEALRKWKANQWKKGTRPHNTLAVGDITTTGDGYLKIKIGEPKQWMLLHHLVWQVYTRGWFEPSGWLPRNKIIQFRDGNRRNCRFDNLYMTDHVDQIHRNSGAVNLPDSMIALYLSGGKKADRELKALLLQNKPVLEAKRNLIRLNRAIKGITNYELRITN